MTGFSGWVQENHRSPSERSGGGNQRAAADGEAGRWRAGQGLDVLLLALTIEGIVWQEIRATSGSCKLALAGSQKEMGNSVLQPHGRWRAHFYNHKENGDLKLIATGKMGAQSYCMELNSANNLSEPESRFFPRGL